MLWLTNIFFVDVVRLLFPAIRWEITAIDDNLSIISLELIHENAKNTVRMRANTVRPVYLNNFVIYPLGWTPGTQGFYQVELSARGVLLSPLILIILILGWPQFSVREFTIRLLLGVPLTALLFALDTPLDLLGNFQRVVVHRFDQKYTPTLFIWDKLLDGGGSFALAIAFAIVAISAALRTRRPRILVVTVPN